MTTTTDQAHFDQALEGLSCDGYLLRCNFARMPLAILRNPNISGGAVRTYGLMLWYLHKGARYPGHPAASHEFNIPQRTLRRHLKELEAADLIQTRRHGRGNPNSYHLPDPRLLPREERPDLAALNLMNGHPGSDARPDLAAHTNTRRTDREESFLSDGHDPKQGPVYEAALAELDQVKADLEAQP